MRLPTYDKPRIIACAEEHSDHIALPRGCMEEVHELLSDLNVETIVEDERNHGEPLNLAFQGTLRPEQQAAATTMAAHDIGVLAATTAFGKTVVVSLVDRSTRREHACAGTPAAAAGSVGPTFELVS
jgi:hypothetical protein